MTAAAASCRNGGWIAAHPPFPTWCWFPGSRAHQTWDIAWEAMKGRVRQPAIELLPELYGPNDATAARIRMASSSDPKRLMLVGHNPACTTGADADGGGDKAAKKGWKTICRRRARGARFRYRRLGRCGFRRGGRAVRQPKRLRQTSND